MLPNVVSNTVLRAHVFTAISFNNYHNCLTNDFDSAEMQPWPASAILLVLFFYSLCLHCIRFSSCFTPVGHV